MRLLRGLLGALLWLGAAVLGLVGVILCATLILLPLGIPVLGYARRLFTTSVRLILPRAVSHPLRVAGENLQDQKHDAGSAVGDAVGNAGRSTRKAARRARKRFA